MSDQPETEPQTETAIHGDPQNQQPPETASATPLVNSIPTVQVDTAIPQSAANVTPQNPYDLNAPALLPVDLNPVPVPEVEGDGESAAVPTSETHLAGRSPSAEI